MYKIAFWINRQVTRIGWVADLVYGLTHYARWFGEWARDRWATTARVPLADALKYGTLRSAGWMNLGVTNICNAKCTFCAYPKVVSNKTLQTGIMSLDVFKQAVSEWSKLGGAGKSIDLTPVVGDPLVDPTLLDKVRFAIREAGIQHVSLTTNGILLDHNLNYQRLIDEGVNPIFISTQGADRAAYETVYGVKQYDKVMSGLRHLLEYNRQKGEPAEIVIRFRNQQKPSVILNSPDFQQYIRPYLSAKVQVNFTVDFDNWGGTITEADMPPGMRLRKQRPLINVPCVGLFGYSVRHDGSVRLCGCRLKTTDMDDLVVGNVMESTLEEITAGDRARKIVEGFYAGVRPETCAGCTFYKPITKAWLQQRQAQTTAAQPAPAPPAVAACQEQS